MVITIIITVAMGKYAKKQVKQKLLKYSEIEKVSEDVEIDNTI